MTTINSINEMMAIAADMEAQRRIIAMMNDAPFGEGSADRFNMTARMIATIWTEEASDRFGSIKAIEETIIELENDLFKSAI